MSEEDIELEEFFEASDTFEASDDSSLVNEITHTPEENLSSQITESSPSASQTPSLPTGSSRKALSDVTQLLLASTAFISCLGTLVALGIQIWSVKVQQGQKMTRSAYSSKRGEGLSMFSLSESTCAPLHMRELPDAHQELQQIYELWAWRITAILSLMMNLAQRGFSVPGTVEAFHLKRLQEALNGTRRIPFFVQRRVKGIEEVVAVNENLSSLEVLKKRRFNAYLKCFGTTWSRSEAELKKDTQQSSQEMVAKVPNRKTLNNTHITAQPFESKNRHKYLDWLNRTSHIDVPHCNACVPYMELLLDASVAPFRLDQPFDFGKEQPLRWRMSFSSLWPRPYPICTILDLALWQRRNCVYANNEMISLIVEAMASKRQQLMHLAKKHLTIPQLKELGWQDPTNKHQLLDLAAGAVCERLKIMGVDVGEDSQHGFGYFRTTVYHNAWINADAAELLFQSGFTDIDELDSNNTTPLFIHAQLSWAGSSGRETAATLLWLLNHGSRKMILPDPSGTTLIHNLAIGLGTPCLIEEEEYDSTKRVTNMMKQNTQQGLSDILGRCASLLSSPLKDHCRCFCSSGGCTPIHTLFKRVPGYNCSKNLSISERYKRFNDRLDLFELWISSCPKALTSSHTYADFCRIELFGMLGMRHTCCRTPKFVKRDDEFDKIQAEDHLLYRRLDHYMSLYRILSAEYSARFTDFWETWWRAIEEVGPAVELKAIGQERIYYGCSPLSDDIMKCSLDAIKAYILIKMFEDPSKRPVLS
ncbi:hypothetical protein MMC10_000654 [Thelotrema lepadinum]|nr:hypothetical protein [Thelotrema lepadinum]